MINYNKISMHCNGANPAKSCFPKGKAGVNKTKSEENVGMLRQFVLFLKNRNELTLDDSAYLSSIPGMKDSIEEGVNTPLSECIPLEKVWAAS